MLILQLICTTIMAADAIGPLSTLQSLTFTGGEPYSDDQLRGALLGHRESFMLLHPLAGRQHFEQAVTKGLERGFKADGHPDAVVTIDWSGAPQRVVAQIDQGIRLACGELVIEGCDDAAVAAILRDGLLLARAKHGGEPVPVGSPDADRPLWPRPKGSPWHRGGLDGIRRGLEASFARAGRSGARFGLVLDRDDAAGVAHLRVQVESLGTPTICREIVVSGLELHQRDEILAALPVRRGEPYGLNEVVAARRILRDSGCFLAATVGPQADDPGVLLIDVVESADLPHFGHDLPPKAAVLRTMALELEAGLREQRLDVACRMDLGERGTVELVLAPGRGLAVKQTPRDGRPVAFLFSEGQAYLRGADGQLVRVASPLLFTLNLQLGTKEPDEEGRNRTANLSAGAVASEERTGLQINIDLEPATLMIAKDLDAYEQATFDGGIELVSTDEDGGSKMRWLLGEDGHLVSFQIASEAGILTVNSGTDLFAQACADWPLAEAQPVSGPRFLVGWLAELVTGVVATSVEQDDIRAGAAAATAVVADLVAALDAAGLLPAVDDERSFAIPPFELGGSADIMAMIREVLPFCYRMSLAVAPYDHWLPTICREATRVVLGDPRTLQPELRRLFNDQDLGPVGCTLLGRLATMVDPTLAEVFTDLAKERSDAEHFRLELLPVLAKHRAALTAVLKRVAEHEQLPAIALLLPADARAPLERGLAAVQAQAGALADDPEARVLAKILWYGFVGKLLADYHQSAAPDPADALFDILE